MSLEVRVSVDAVCIDIPLHADGTRGLVAVYLSD
ncbi:MAG: hypothetical protein ACJA0Z_004152, partial [Halioglobus sp.]